jgi:hypothetical protein
MLDKLKQFYATHKVSTHTIAVLFLAATAAYKEVPAFHDAVTAVYLHLPSKVQTVITTGLALYAWYRNGQKQ